MANTNKVIWGRELEYVMPRGMYEDLRNQAPSNVNTKDWVILYNHINEVDVLTGVALANADVNNDGKVNMKDWNRLYDHISEVDPLW